jgi:hypothetical protein
VTGIRPIADCCSEQTTCPVCLDWLCPDHSGDFDRGGFVHCEYHECPTHGDCHEQACGHLASCGGAA